MSRLIIVAGAGGAGKSFLLKVWQDCDRNSVGIDKFVSEERMPRASEVQTGEADLIFDARYDPTTDKGQEFYKTKFSDLVCSSKLRFHNKKFALNGDEKDTFFFNDPYTYDYRGTHYRVDVEAIDTALSQGKTPIAIVRKSETIKKLLEKYHNSLVIYVQSVLSGEDLIKKLIELHETEEDSKTRGSRNKEDLEDYIENIHLIQTPVRVILNDFTNENLKKQIKNIYKEEIENHCFEHKSIFVIQSYADEKISLENYEQIEDAAKRYFGQSYKMIHRADLLRGGTYSIPNNVWDSIDGCDCIICDISHDRCDCCREIVGDVEKKTKQGTSSNVWLELGYAIKTLKDRKLGLKDRLMIIAKEDRTTKPTTTPTDLEGLNIVYYSTQRNLMEKVEENLRKMFKK